MPTGNSQIVELLQSSLRLHWSAVEVYAAQARHYATWGYPKLAEKYTGDADEERGHAQKLIDRLEFYDVQPAVDHVAVEWPRHDFVGAVDANYEMETAAAAVERSGYQVSVELGDAVTADLFRELLADSEASLIEIESVREVIDTISLDNFLANQA